MGNNSFMLVGVSLLLTSAFSTIIITSHTPKMVQLGQGKVGIILDDEEDTVNKKYVSSTPVNTKQLTKNVIINSEVSTEEQGHSNLVESSFLNKHVEPQIAGGAKTVYRKIISKGQTSNQDLEENGDSDISTTSSKQVASTPTVISTRTISSQPSVTQTKPILGLADPIVTSSTSKSTTPMVGLASPTTTTSSTTTPTLGLANPTPTPTLTSSSSTPTTTLTSTVPMLGLANPTPTPTPTPTLASSSSISTSTPILKSASPLSGTSTSSIVTPPKVTTSASSPSSVISTSTSLLSGGLIDHLSTSDLHEKALAAMKAIQGNGVHTSQVSNGSGDLHKTVKALGAKKDLNTQRKLVEVNKKVLLSSPVS